MHCSEEALLSEEDGPSVDSTMPREGMEEEPCEVSAAFSCEEVMEEEASIGMNDVMDVSSNRIQ